MVAVLRARRSPISARTISISMPASRTTSRPKPSLFDPERGLLAPARAARSSPRMTSTAAGSPLRHPEAVTFGLAADADWRADRRPLRAGRVGFRRLAPGAGRGGLEVTSGCRGRSTWQRAVALACWRRRVRPAGGARGVAGLAGVPGRMERSRAGQPFLALVDYAHTPGRRCQRCCRRCGDGARQAAPGAGMRRGSRPGQAADDGRGRRSWAPT